MMSFHLRTLRLLLRPIAVVVAKVYAVVDSVGGVAVIDVGSRRRRRRRKKNWFFWQIRVAAAATVAIVVDDYRKDQAQVSTFPRLQRTWPILPQSVCDGGDHGRIQKYYHMAINSIKETRLTIDCYEV